MAEPELKEDGFLVHLLEAYDRPWAITQSWLDGLLRAAREGDRLEALAARLGKPLDTARHADVENRDGTAVINVRGPLFRYRSIFTWLLGGTSMEQLALDFQAAMDDPAIRRVVLAVDSPGGQIDGIHEMANMIRNAHAAKPVTAYVDGLAGSGAYWLASAAGRIVADETAQLGSIGVLATVWDDRDAQERHGIRRFEIISSQSPFKRSDPRTDEGRGQIQRMVDGLAQTFIDKVAQFRQTSATKVARDYGQGAVLAAREAITVGMADDLGSLEGLLRESPQAVAVTGISAQAQEVKKMAKKDDQEECTCPEGAGPEECDCEDDGKEASVATITTERQRIAAILNCEEARGREELARVLALDTDHNLATAKKILQASPVSGKSNNALERRMAQITNPTVGVSADEETNTAQAEASRILAFVPEDRKVKAVHNGR